jgi:thiosulfate reductase cytochrome b subunit
VTAAHVKSNSRHDVKLHPLPVRLMHWINALAMIIMISSGWEEITLGKWAQHGLQWHFFAMWILVLNGLAYLTYGLVTGRFRRKLLPLSWREIIATMRDALAFRLKHDELTQYNAVQKLLYVGIILVGIVTVLSGLSIWKPVQLSELAMLFYDFQTARLVHFLCMTAIVMFLIVHVALTLLVPQTLIAMLTGGPVIKTDEPHAGARPV